MDANLAPLIDTAKQLALLAETLDRRGGAAVAQQEQASQTLARTVSTLRVDVDRLIQGAGHRVSQAARQGIDATLGESAARFDQTATAAGAKVQAAATALDEGLMSARATLSRQLTRGYLAILGAMLLTWHNLHYYQDIMRGLRGAIEGNSLCHWIAAFEKELSQGDLPEI